MAGLSVKRILAANRVGRQRIGRSVDGVHPAKGFISPGGSSAKGDISRTASAYRYSVSTSGKWRRRWDYVWSYVRSAPWTFGWLTVLLATTIVQHSVSRATLKNLLEERSTNLDNLNHDPVQVLVQSLLWVDGYFWLPYLFMYWFLHAPAERWLGAWRWAVIGLSAHVAATYISEGVLRYAIRHGMADPQMVDVRDIGVSYFLAAIVGVLTYHVVKPWRWAYLAIILAIFGLPLIFNLSFTGIGHFSSMLIGLAWYPLTSGRRRELWDPMDSYQRWRQRRGRHPQIA